MNTPCVISDGYGDVYRLISVKVNGKWKLVYAHRHAWEQKYGKIPRGLYVCHHCDNPPCINTEHLFLGTAKQNSDDAKKKGRLKGPEGELNGWAKLTATNVRTLRLAQRMGCSREWLARRYNVRKRYVGKIVQRQIWKSV